jgi:hypothetical protein
MPHLAVRSLTLAITCSIVVCFLHVPDFSAATLLQDIRLVIISLLVFIVVAVLFFSHLNLVKTRTSLALVGM